MSLAETLELIAKQGYQRLLLDDEIVRLPEAAGHPALQKAPPELRVVQDRVMLAPANRARFIEACEQAYHFGKGRLTLYPIGGAGSKSKVNSSAAQRFSQGYHCASCDLDYREPTPALFSFNHPLGACPNCKGFGRIITIDYNLAIPDRSKTLADGCVRPWQTGHGLESQRDLMKFCRKMDIPVNVPFAKLPQSVQDWVVDGDKDYGIDEDHEWPRAWYGVRGYFRWLESKAYKMHVRVLLSRYRAYSNCPECRGQRFKPDSLLFRVPVPKLPEEFAEHHQLQGYLAASGSTRSLSLAELYALPVEQALAVLDLLAQPRLPQTADPIALALAEVRARLQYLVQVGLGYLTLERPMRTLSGGETERVNLTTCLGTRLCNTLFVLDEPSVGLHPRDTSRLVGILEKLRDTGNTVVVVEHEASVMRAADRIVDLGPGRGEQGGQIVFDGPTAELLRHEMSLTGQYLSGRRTIPIPKRRPVRLSVRGDSLAVTAREGSTRYEVLPTETDGSLPFLREAAAPAGEPMELPPPLEETPSLYVAHATRHNLADLELEVPLSRLVCLTGVSGSGKTTLVREILLPTLTRHLQSGAGAGAADPGKASDRLNSTSDEDDSSSGEATSPSECVIEGWEGLTQVVLVDQSPLGKTPRSNPVVYIGAFDDLRDLFAQTELAKQRGLNGSAFSFNSGVGQCERCRGAGFEKIEMQFLSDIFIRCPECNGRRYREHILEVKLTASPSSGGVGNPETSKSATGQPSVSWSVADLLEATVDEALDFLQDFKQVPAGRRASARLSLLQEVGLGYLRLGQPINTLSGGESQRLKLVSHLADSVARSVQGNRRVKSMVQTRRTGSDRVAALVGPKLRVASELLETNAGDELDQASTLFLFDEPTTGLHFEDVRVLLQVFQRLVDAGHSLVVIEHNIDVIKCADWVIDLGPEAGERGGKLVACGTPEQVANCPASHTGTFLRDVLEQARHLARGPRLVGKAEGPAVKN